VRVRRDPGEELALLHLFDLHGDCLSEGGLATACSGREGRGWLVVHIACFAYVCAHA
jgi:hypothetical protein